MFNPMSCQALAKRHRATNHPTSDLKGLTGGAEEIRSSGEGVEVTATGSRASSAQSKATTATMTPNSIKLFYQVPATSRSQPVNRPPNPMPNGIAALTIPEAMPLCASGNHAVVMLVVTNHTIPQP